MLTRLGVGGGGGGKDVVDAQDNSMQGTPCSLHTSLLSMWEGCHG